MDQNRRKIVEFYKILICFLLTLFLIFPWVLSIAALSKINSLQAQLDTVLGDRIESSLAMTDSTQRSTASSVPANVGATSVAKSQKTAYLTFDDGPSANTEAILEILNHYGIKATFFVLGRTDNHSIQMYNSILSAGHSLGLHSYTHNYAQVYASADACMSDIDRLDRLLFDSTGEHSTIYRFPGGSSNEIASREEIAEVASRLAQRGLVYFDWNVSSGDGSASQPTVAQIVSNVVNGAQGKPETVILMHDSSVKGNTVEALPRVIELLQEQGFVFDRISQETPPIQHRVFAIT